MILVTSSRAGGEMVDALALGASGVTHGGSSPLPRTRLLITEL